MSTFAKQTFSAAKYATFRPSYSRSLYDAVLKYHNGPQNLCLDLGTGHGLIARELSPSFKVVIGTDPSLNMVEQARRATTGSKYANVKFEKAAAESLAFIDDGSVDLVVSGQAAHWFDFDQVWSELTRILRKGATLAFWGYKEAVFVDYPQATKLFHALSSPYNKDPSSLGPYWEPGRKIVVDNLRNVKIPTTLFQEEQRIEYEPGTKGARSGEGTMFVNASMSVKALKGYIRTFSAFHEWQAAHPEKKAVEDGGPGDFADEFLREAAKQEDVWNDLDKEVDVEWGGYLLMARKR